MCGVGGWGDVMMDAEKLSHGERERDSMAVINETLWLSRL